MNSRKHTSQGKLDKFPLTDRGNAERLISTHGQDLRYVYQRKRWLAWATGRWELDQCRLAVIGLAKEILRDRLKASVCESDIDRRNRSLRFFTGSETASRVRSMVELAESESGVAISVGDLDSDPWLLCCTNGTIDLRTGKLRDHRRKDLITQQAPVAFDPEAKCPNWLDFLHRIFSGRQPLIDYIQRLLGYTLTGLTDEQVMVFLYGCGANGKSTLLEAVRHIWGDYARTSPASMLTAKTGQSGANNDIARLKGARFAKAVESEQGHRLAEAQVKELTGGDTITARFMYNEFFEMTPTWKLFLATNYLPRVRGDDNAIWRRVHTVPFDVSIPPAEQDQKLLGKLKAEASGILAWAVEGCLKWQQEGLNPPPEVLQANQAYRSQMDTVGPFLEACCSKDTGSNVKTSALYLAYETYCSGEGRDKLDRSSFRAAVEEKGFQIKKIKGGNDHYMGLDLRSGLDEVA